MRNTLREHHKKWPGIVWECLTNVSLPTWKDTSNALFIDIALPPQAVEIEVTQWTSGQWVKSWEAILITAADSFLDTAGIFLSSSVF